MKRILFIALGSLGDLHPAMGVAHELKRQGHKVGIASGLFYKEYVESTGLRFHPIRPDISPNDNKVIQVVMDPYRGPERLHREYLLPNLENSLLDCLEIVKEYDLMVCGVLSYFVPIASKLTGIPWVSQLLSPMCMWSAYDPPVLAPLPWLGRARHLGPTFHRTTLRLLLQLTESWTKPIYRLRKKYGLGKGPMPLSEGTFSEYLTLCLWHNFFGPPQPDWPKNTRVAGFVFYDPKQNQPLQEKTLDFLNKGEKPILFTLGSTAVQDTKNYLDLFIRSSKLTGKRAIVTIGKNRIESLRHLESESIHFLEYAPYSLLFPKVAQVVHQGGVGTTAQAICAGLPMLVLAKSMDQFDNGDRAKRLGLGHVLSLRSATPKNITNMLDRIGSDAGIKANCETYRKACAENHGASVAAKILLDYGQL